jgi:hypothetical protein
MKFLSVFFVAVIFTSSAHAGWRDWFKKAEEVMAQTQQPTNANANASANAEAEVAFPSLSQADISAGLKQALSVGAQRAVQQIGAVNGFNADGQIRVPLPAQMQNIASLMEKFGQGVLVEQFQTSLNRAAERAVPEALPIFESAISSMTLTDAMGILKGADNSATAYFETKTSVELEAKIAPLVADAMAKSQVNTYYKNMIDTAKSYDKLGLMGIYMPEGSTDVDAHVTSYAMAGLFTKLADEEKKIRDNPQQRTTELMKKVFSQD